jgi:hypothetical protein
MQHEVLLAALGMPGDVIVPAYPASSSSSSSASSSVGMTYAVAPDITFLSAGTRKRRKGRGVEGRRACGCEWVSFERRGWEGGKKE